ncbi:low molecular weight phosphatase family protein [Actinoplanes sp. NEAU-A12]|uniref:Low molecular weight phosphatase family protein n=1 Tax=Actinoplanes sandaracinus TaxID=3045177 RepID=A0ABT6WNS9_9ACTN|nr:low molecular weight phosphatase family protein [Actinoplanes sandaracinus]MDI6101300.1 low molecular weight phosphatase family protein [Actinoplanes sandaracinus]
MDQEQFRVLVVCHANLCRSPMAERLLRHGLAARLGSDDAAFQVGSAGTHAEADRPMHPLAWQVLTQAGVGSAGFRSRPLTGNLVAEADLVLTATRRQRSACVSLDPAAVRRTFTMRQFGRYAAAFTAPDAAPATPQQRLRALLERVPLIRAGLPIVPADQDDLPDPVQQQITAFRQCRTTIEQIVEAMATLIAGNPPTLPSAPPPAVRRLRA